MMNKTGEVMRRRDETYEESQTRPVSDQVARQSYIRLSIWTSLNTIPQKGWCTAIDWMFRAVKHKTKSENQTNT